MLKHLLENNKCFKLVCGAGNEDAKGVKNLVKIYSKAGCEFFDLCAKPQIIEAAKQGLENRKASLCVSIGIKGDPHFRKAHIDSSKCARCGKCSIICPENAIFKESKRCIGCGRCEKVCPQNAIIMKDETQDLNEILPPLIKMGIDCIELHTIGFNAAETFDKWNIVNNLFKGFLSICTDRSLLCDKEIVSLVKKLLEKRKPYTTIIQADGAPMSGGKDDYNTTLQAIAAADIFQKENLPAYLIVSGGTNSKTAELAKICSVKINGVAIGSYARKILASSSLLGEKEEAAKHLIERTLKFLR